MYFASLSIVNLGLRFSVNHKKIQAVIVTPLFSKIKKTNDQFRFYNKYFNICIEKAFQTERYKTKR